jgi:uncharacterized protein
LSSPLALVTGASSGIGRALALRLASEGYDLILVGRDRQALSAVAAEASPAHCRIESIDLSCPGAGLQLMCRLGSSLDVLVNNAGFGLHGKFLDTALEDERALVSLQIGALLELTKAALPTMVERGRGRILNVASVYAFSPVPKQSVYSATKAFMLSFSQSLADELAGTGVTVTTLCPGITSTQFRSRAGMKEKQTRLSMTAEQVADAGYKGMIQGRRIVVPGLQNKAFSFISPHAPSGLTTAFIRRINRGRGLQ